MAPIDRRIAAWSNLASEIKPETLEKMTQQINLADSLAWAPKILAGEVRGRLVVDVNA
jgi:acrylyl-CoA reductase (NADPH)